MATKIVTKNSSTAGAAPTATDLVQGELAVNVADKRLFTEDNGGSIVELGTNPYNFTANHDGSAKLATTATGIDVTGTATMDGLTVDGTSNLNGVAQVGGSTDLLYLSGKTGTHAYMSLGGSSTAEDFFIGADTAIPLIFRTSATERMRIDSTGINVTGTATMDGLTVSTAGVNYLKADQSLGSIMLQTNGANNRAFFAHTGDISFYEDTGTTPKFFWDASAESLGIGTSSPQNLLHINKSDSLASAMQFTNSTTGATSSDGVFVGLGSGEQGYFWNYEANDLILGTNNTERMRIDSSGNVKQNSVNTSTNVGYSVNNGTYDAIALGTGGFGVNGGAATDGGIRAYNNLLFGTGASATERMRILSDGAAAFGCTTSRPAEFTHPDGFAIRYDVRGQFQNTVTNAACGIINRDGTDGDLLSFRKDGASVGSIGTLVSSLTIGSGDTGLILQPAYDRILPFNVSTNAGRDNAIDLGASGSRFKDLYLSSKTKYQASGGNQHSIGADANDLIIRSETAGSETARFTYGGNLLVGTTTTNIATEGTVLYGGNDKGVMTLSTISKPALYVNRSNAGSVVQFRTGGSTIVGSIDITASATTYSTSSDQRLKDNIADADDAGSKIDAIQVRKYDWKADGSHQDYGMIAQELQAVAPEAVSGDADSEEMMGVDYSKLVPMLIKEIQSLRNRVAQLETGE